MTWGIILQIILLGIALSMDAFAVSVTDGLTYTDINKKKSFFIAGVFGVMQALMPLLGFWLVEGISVLVGATGGAQAGKIMSEVWSKISLSYNLFYFLKNRGIFLGFFLKKNGIFEFYENKKLNEVFNKNKEVILKLSLLNI